MAPFGGEAMFWGFALGMILLAVTLQPAWIVALSIGAPVAHVLVMQALKAGLSQGLASRVVT
jgi:hypothetical protein